MAAEDPPKPPIKVNVTTLNLQTDGSRNVVIDHANFKHRKWLERHIFWAMRNDRMVAASPAAPDAEITLGVTVKFAKHEWAKSHG